MLPCLSEQNKDYRINETLANSSRLGFGQNLSTVILSLGTQWNQCCCLTFWTKLKNKNKKSKNKEWSGIRNWAPELFVACQKSKPDLSTWQNGGRNVSIAFVYFAASPFHLIPQKLRHRLLSIHTTIKVKAVVRQKDDKLFVMTSWDR